MATFYRVIYDVERSELQHPERGGPPFMATIRQARSAPFMRRENAEGIANEYRKQPNVTNVRVQTIVIDDG